jgi:putative tryptophan/tyrosine transport system substrate-binding protein
VEPLRAAVPCLATPVGPTPDGQGDPVIQFRNPKAEIRRIAAAILVVALAPGVIATPLVVGAQPLTKAPKSGVLLYAAAPAPGHSNPLLDAFREGLRDLGYVEGRDVILEYRWAGGSDQRAADLAAELVRLNVAVIVSTGTPATLAARAATTTIPIVMTAVGDPVGSGIVASLARPGGHVTGLSLLDTDLDGKRIELLKEAVPGLTRIAMLWNPDDPGMTLAFNRVEAASHTLRLALQSVAVRDPGRFLEARQAVESGRAEALIVTAQPFTIRNQIQILNVATSLRLPAIYTDRRFVDAGGLMAYGPSLLDVYRRAATYVDRILKGAHPHELPVQQPATFELVVNLKSAKAIGVAIPQSVLIRADEVIQ